MFKHILFPTDLSDAANSGFHAAVDMAQKYGAKISVLNVHEEFMSDEEMQTLRVSVERYKEVMRERAEQCRDQIRQMIQDAGFEGEHEILLREGHPRKEIVNGIRELNADLVVMASSGRSNLAEAFMGSVAEYVVRHSPQAVLVIKAKK